ncbi:hypothetical protein FHY52_33185, partial [Nocardia nova]|nr:hypothetical protein [Nocardia nova]
MIVRTSRTPFPSPLRAIGPRDGDTSVVTHIAVREPDPPGNGGNLPRSALTRLHFDNARVYHVLHKGVHLRERTLVAKKVITKTVVTDDFDGNEIQDGHALEVKISIAGTEYRLDLRPENVDKFRAHIRKWLDAAQSVGAGPAPETSAETRATPARRTGRPTTKRG